MRALFNVLVDREYIQENPFSNIRQLKATQKRRKVFTESEQKSIIKYIASKDKQLLLAVSLCYYCAIRPAELRRLKIEDIILDKGIITMQGSQTKNKENAIITIPLILLPFLLSLHLDDYPEHYFVFGSRSLRPGAKRCGRDTISKRHKKALQELHKLNFIEDIEGKSFYSWKDTAAKDLINQDINILELKQHFRHKKISTTQKYMQENLGVISKIRDNSKRLF